MYYFGSVVILSQKIVFAGSDSSPSRSGLAGSDSGHSRSATLAGCDASLSRSAFLTGSDHNGPPRSAPLAGCDASLSRSAPIRSTGRDFPFSFNLAGGDLDLPRSASGCLFAGRENYIPTKETLGAGYTSLSHSAPLADSFLGLPDRIVTIAAGSNVSLLVRRPLFILF